MVTTDGACDDDIVSVPLNAREKSITINLHLLTQLKFARKLVNFVFINLSLVPVKILLKFTLNLFFSSLSDDL